MVVAALTGVLMIMAHGAGGFELAPEIRLDSRAGVARGADYDLDIALVEDIHGAAAHAAGDYHLDLSLIHI